MQLEAYLALPDALSVADLSRAIGCKPSQVWQWVIAARDPDPARRPGAAYCSAIQLATDRKVMRWDLRPEDWFRIWPEMVDADGAPAVEDEAA